MIRSIYSGVSGLRNHQIRMDVIGNNIANVNTVGFKSSRVVFEDLYSQTIKPSSTTTVGGGTNPQQVGMGVGIASIDVMQDRSSAQYTGAPLDVMIEGDGYFVVNNGAGNLFTRAGNFYTDKDNNLVNANGFYVQGYDPVTNTTTNINIPSNYYDVSIDKSGAIVGIDSTTNTKVTIGQLCIANFNNPASLEKIGENMYTENANSGAPVFTNPGQNGSSLLNPGALEMSNVDLSKEFTDMIITQRGFQANSRVITTSDQLLEEIVNLKR